MSRAAPKFQNSGFCVAKTSASKFLTLSKLDRVTIAICASSHGMPFNIVDDEVSGRGFEAGSYSRQQITDQASKLAANWRNQIKGFLRRNFFGGLNSFSTYLLFFSENAGSNAGSSKRFAGSIFPVDQPTFRCLVKVTIHWATAVHLVPQFFNR